jgi:hypothetical protein
MTTGKKEDRSDVQGEGDYRAAREFNEKERTFVRSHDTEERAEDAAPDDSSQAAELERAEREGKAHARPDPDAQAPDDESDAADNPAGQTPPGRRPLRG